MSDTGFFLLPTNKLYRKENTQRLKNFPAGYVGNFYRNLADNINTDSDFYSRIAADSDIPKEDVQKYLLATSGFAKSIQTDINLYVTGDPGKEFEIQKRLDKLRSKNDNFNNNNNNNNNDNNVGGNTGGTNINLDNYGLNQPPPSLPNIKDFIDNGAPPPPQPPSAPFNENLFNTTNQLSTPKTGFDVETENPFILPTIWDNKGIGNNLFGSQAIMAGPREQDKTITTKTQQEIDDFLYELPDTRMPTLELGDGLVQSLGTEAEDLFDPNAPLTKKEEEDEVLKKIMEEYKIDDIKETMDETGDMPESIYFSYGGDSQKFVDALEFVGLSPINIEFAAFLLSDLGRQTMTKNKLSIHVELGDVFYDNQNTGENFYSFLLSQQNDEVAYVPKKISYINSFEQYITTFLQAFSIDDQEKFDLLAFKNSKYLF